MRVCKTYYVEDESRIETQGNVERSSYNCMAIIIPSSQDGISVRKKARATQRNSFAGTFLSPTIHRPSVGKERTAARLTVKYKKLIPKREDIHMLATCYYMVIIDEERLPSSYVIMDLWKYFSDEWKHPIDHLGENPCAALGPIPISVKAHKLHHGQLNAQNALVSLRRNHPAVGRYRSRERPDVGKLTKVGWKHHGDSSRKRHRGN